MSNDNVSKEPQESNKIDIDSFEFFEDKKPEGAVEQTPSENPQTGANPNNNETVSSNMDVNVEVKQEQKNESEQSAKENIIEKFEGASGPETKSDLFSFEEVKPEKKEEFANEVDKMLSQINN